MRPTSSSSALKRPTPKPVTVPPVELSRALRSFRLSPAKRVVPHRAGAGLFNGTALAGSIPRASAAGALGSVATPSAPPFQPSAPPWSMLPTSSPQVAYPSLGHDSDAMAKLHALSIRGPNPPAHAAMPVSALRPSPSASPMPLQRTLPLPPQPVMARPLSLFAPRCPFVLKRQSSRVSSSPPGSLDGPIRKLAARRAARRLTGRAPPPQVSYQSAPPPGHAALHGPNMCQCCRPPPFWPQQQARGQPPPPPRRNLVAGFKDLHIVSVLLRGGGRPQQLRVSAARWDRRRWGPPRRGGGRDGEEGVCARGCGQNDSGLPVLRTIKKGGFGYNEVCVCVCNGPGWCRLPYYC
jgi:hypothetical protein